MGTKKEIGETIKVMRMSRGMTQKDLAEAIGQTPSSITMYETGKRYPGPEVMEALADTFNVPMAAFFPSSNEPKTYEARIISNGVDRMSKEQREKVLEIFQVLFDKYINGGDDNGT